ncbi:uncharacterized protein TNCV_973011 [Trichonephila clavipes]|nr:uncharacterized protein TNCV_973011 [Trichonephila clavipes]
MVSSYCINVCPVDDEEMFGTLMKGGSPPSFNTADLSLSSRVISHAHMTAVMNIRYPICPMDEDDDPKGDTKTVDDCQEFHQSSSSSKRRSFTPRKIVHHRSPLSPVLARSFEGQRGRDREQPMDLSSDTGPTRWKLNPEDLEEGSSHIYIYIYEQWEVLIAVNMMERTKDLQWTKIVNEHQSWKSSTSGRDRTGSESSPSTSLTG